MSCVFFYGFDVASDCQIECFEFAPSICAWNALCLFVVPILVLFTCFHIILLLQIDLLFSRSKLWHVLLSLFGYPNQVYSILSNKFEVVPSFRAQPTTRPISFGIRESSIQPALRGRAFPIEMDASELDVTISPTPKPRGCKMYLLSPSV